jgi:hypothetical protein
LSPKRWKRPPRGVVDTSVLVAGISGFRDEPSDNPSAALIAVWAEAPTFVWLLTEEILSEYVEVLERFGNKVSSFAFSGKFLTCEIETTHHLRVRGIGRRRLPRDPESKRFPSEQVEGEGHRTDRSAASKRTPTAASAQASRHSQEVANRPFSATASPLHSKRFDERTRARNRCAGCPPDGRRRSERSMQPCRHFAR